MKIIAFTDMHSSLKRLIHLENLVKLKKPDLLICAGDLTLFGRNLNLISKRIDSWNIPTLIIPGNHETEEEIKSISKKYKNLKNIHHIIYQKGNYTYFGMGQGGFSRTNKEFESLFSKIKKQINPRTKLAVISHAPPYGTKTDLIDDEYAGSISLRKFIEFAKPVLVVVGHMHECEHTEDKIGTSRIINPGDGEFISI